MASDARLQEQSILDGANYLLHAVGIHAAPIQNFSELAESASSLFVAVFEAMFHTRLQDIVRQPTQDAHFVHNAQVVINTLANSVLQKNLEYISGEDVHAGDRAAVANLINIFRLIDKHAKDQADMFGRGPEQYEDDDNDGADEVEVDDVDDGAYEETEDGMLDDEIGHAEDAKYADDEKFDSGGSEGKDAKSDDNPAGAPLFDQHSPLRSGEHDSTVGSLANMYEQLGGADGADTGDANAVPSGNTGVRGGENGVDGARPASRRRRRRVRRSEPAMADPPLPRVATLEPTEIASAYRTPAQERERRARVTYAMMLRDHDNAERHRQRMKHQAQLRTIRGQNRDRRLQQIQARRLSETLSLRARSLRMKRDSQANMKTRNFMRTALKLETQWLADESREAKQEQRLLEQARENEAISISRFYEDQIGMMHQKVEEQRHAHGLAERDYSRATRKKLNEMKKERAEWLNTMMEWLENWDHGQFEGEPNMREVVRVLRGVSGRRAVGPGVGKRRRKANKRADISGSPRPAWT